MLQLLSSSSALLPAALACDPVSMLRPGMGRCGCNCMCEGHKPLNASKERHNAQVTKEMPSPWQPCRGSREAVPAAHPAQAQEGDDHGYLLSQRLHAEETKALRRDEGAMATGAVQLGGHKGLLSARGNMCTFSTRYR